MLAALLKRNFYRAAAVAPDTMKPRANTVSITSWLPNLEAWGLVGKPFIFIARTRRPFDVPVPG
jgi:hypothetical protein